MSSSKFTNRLIEETSPYLLQHAHNPVDWYPWGEEALQKAKDEDKPVLVSIGYSACHWCHVMERESFEDEDTAEIMNAHFINIKIDREERPDLDHIYMDAVQAIAGSGGWPLNVFLTPDAKPFYGGTYFPPVNAHNRMSWKETLNAVHKAYTERKNEMESQAENLIAHLKNANSFGISKPGLVKPGDIFTEQNLEKIAENLLAQGDSVWGGFGKAPKFPQTFAIQFLLRHYHFAKDERSLKQALLSLDKMIMGGIYDQLGGGFARYSTDAKWLAPHFEKMLYDNALLVSVMAEAYQLTGDDLYATVIKQTLAFVESEFLSPEGGFYSALDADSEGVEGKYYVWNKSEIAGLLGDRTELFCKIYNITDGGNWEHTNILWLTENLKSHAEKLEMGVKELKGILEECRNKLLAQRRKRIKPSLDDKILLGWNALMITACCKAYAATKEADYLAMAEQNIAFLKANLCDASGVWAHTWKAGKARYPAFLDDYAYLIQALIHLQEITGNGEYLLKAKTITENVLDLFFDEETPFLWFTDNLQKDIIVRKKEVYDGAVPSGNAVMAQNLLYLSVVFENNRWKKIAEKMLEALGGALVKYSTSFGIWALLLQSLVKGIFEIAIVGNETKELLMDVNSLFIPNKVIQSTNNMDNDFPLLKGKLTGLSGRSIYLCRDYSCKNPVNNVEDLILLMKE